jgi:hypothetical protein
MLDPATHVPGEGMHRMSMALVNTSAREGGAEAVARRLLSAAPAARTARTAMITS